MKTNLLFALVMATADLGWSAGLDEILSYRTIGELASSPDGTRVAFVVTTPDLEANRMNSELWVVSLDGSDPRQLSHHIGRDGEPRWSSDGRWIAFLSDRGGQAGVWVMPPDGGEARLGIPFEGSVSGFEWLPDGGGFVFTGREKRPDEPRGATVVDATPDNARLYRYRTGDDRAVALTELDYHVGSFDVSLSPSTGPTVVFTSQPTPKVPDERLHSDLKRLSLTTGAIDDLVGQPGLDRSPRFSPDGESVAFISMAGRFDWLANYFIYSVATDGDGAPPFNLSEAFDERVDYHSPGGERAFQWSADGKHVYFMGQDGADHRLWKLRVEGGEVAPVGDFDRGASVGSFAVSPSGEVLVSLSGPNLPAELYRVSAEDGSLHGLTALNAAYPVERSGRTEVVSYRSFDGVEMSGFLVRPSDFERRGPHPLLVVVHGGPMGVFGSDFSPRQGAYPIHAFAEAGHVVFMPNPRGSGGFGEAMRKSNVRDWGFGDFKDVMAGVDHLVERGIADPDRMGIMGWSYGGFMTAWAITQTDRFKAASIGAAITNPYSFYGVTDIPDFVEAYFGGPPWKEGTDYLRHAAEHHVSKVKTPSLLQHGEEDRRVPLSQSWSFYRALTEVGVTVEMVTYPRTPHGMKEPRLIRDAMQRNLEWFDRFLGSRVDSLPE